MLLVCSRRGGRMKQAQESSISPLHQTLLGRKIGTKASPLPYTFNYHCDYYLAHENVRPDKGRLGKETQVLPRGLRGE